MVTLLFELTLSYSCTSSFSNFHLSFGSLSFLLPLVSLPFPFLLSSFSVSKLSLHVFLLRLAVLPPCSFSHFFFLSPLLLILLLYPTPTSRINSQVLVTLFGLLLVQLSFISGLGRFIDRSFVATPPNSVRSFSL